MKQQKIGSQSIFIAALGFFFHALKATLKTHKRLNRTHFIGQDKMQNFKESPLFQASNITLQKKKKKEMKGISSGRLSCILPAGMYARDRVSIY